MSVLESPPKQIRNGEKFTITGYYKYAGHVVTSTENCFIPMQSARILFKSGETAPMLGSCPHDVKWELISKY